MTFIVQIYCARQANLTNMEMFAPLKGSLRRTNYEGVELTASMSENEYSLHAKIGYVQVHNYNDCYIHVHIMTVINGYMYMYI